MITETLADNGIRATYEAVAELVGTDIGTLQESLGPCRPSMSWVVSEETGRPVDCPDETLASALFRNPVIIRDAARLRWLVEASSLTREAQ